MFSWTLTDSSETADPNGAPIAEGFAYDGGCAGDDAAEALAAAVDAAGLGSPVDEREADGVYWARYADGTRLTVNYGGAAA